MELRTVVVGMDFNEPSLSAARWTAKHFAPGAELVVVHTIEILRPPRFLEDVLPPADQLLEAAQQDAEPPLREFARSIEADKIRLMLRIGRPSDEIAEVAREVDADLIVVGERGQREGARGGPGSTAEQLARCAPAPVLIARGLPSGRPERILVPVDESALARPVLNWARFLSRKFEARLIALNTLSYGLYGAFRLARSTEEAERLEEESRQAATSWLEARLKETDVDPEIAEVQIAFGQPGFEIVDAADRTNADLIVMGSRGRGQVEPSVLGGVASAVLRGSRLPILIVVDPSCA